MGLHLGALLGLSWGSFGGPLGAPEGLLGPSWKPSIKRGVLYVAPQELLIGTTGIGTEKMGYSIPRRALDIELQTPELNSINSEVQY